MVLGDRTAAGVNVIRRLLSERAIDPATGCPPMLTDTPIEALTMFNGSLNCRSTMELIRTPVSPLAGLLATRCGTSLSGVNAVVKLNAVEPERLLPEVSLIKLELRRTTNVRPTPSGGLGTNAAVRPLGSTCTIPPTFCPLVLSVMVKLTGVRAPGSIRLLNCNVNAVLVGAPVAPLTGLVWSTTGGLVSMF